MLLFRSLEDIKRELLKKVQASVVLQASGIGINSLAAATAANDIKNAGHQMMVLGLMENVTALEELASSSSFFNATCVAAGDENVRFCVLIDCINYIC